MSDFKFPSQKVEKPQVAYSEMKIKALITEIVLKKDKNDKDYWVIRTQDAFNTKSYVAFSQDYNLSQKAAYLLMNPTKLIDQMTTLTIKKKDDKEKVTEIVIEK